MSAREDSLTLTAAGDAIIARKLSTLEDDRFHDLVELIQETDAAMVNLETLLHDYEGEGLYPTGGKAGTYMHAPPWVADELTWAGFNLFTAGTNHSNDYSHGGMLETIRNLEERNIAYAGLGRNLADAREPAYVDTAAGRVALVGACATIWGNSIAGEQRRDMQGRPGISPLRHEARYVVPEEDYERMQAISESLGLEELKAGRDESSFPYLYPLDGEGYFELPNVDGENIRVERGDDYRVEYHIDERDLEALTDQVARARRQADWVVASLHAHEAPGGKTNEHECASFVEEYARACIDAGADAFMGHGAHHLQGIEIYDGAPICYGLGNFVLQSELVRKFPTEFYERYEVHPDEYPEDVLDKRVYHEDGRPKGTLANSSQWQTALPICEFEGGELSDLTLYPVDLMQEEPRPRRGRPVLAQGEQAEETLGLLADLSAAYGTDVTIEDGVGRVEL